MSISGNEWIILNALWKKSPLTLKQLSDGVGAENGWTKHNVISTLKRMAAKGSITVDQREERKYFYPAIDEETAKRQETDALTEKVYGGSRLLLLSSIVEEQPLSDEEAAELLSILEKRRD